MHVIIAAAATYFTAMLLAIYGSLGIRGTHSNGTLRVGMAASISINVSTFMIKYMVIKTNCIHLLLSLSECYTLNVTHYDKVHNCAGIYLTYVPAKTTHKNGNSYILLHLAI